MTHQLTRAVWARRKGWLAERRLLIPADSRPWMFEALRLAGIPEGRCLLQPRERTLRLRDAWLVSAFEHPGATLLRATRELLWGGAEVSEGGAPERLVFLNRPAGARRPVFDGERLLAVVRAAGFESVDPGELSVAEQVRLLAGARSVAGFDGAATDQSYVRAPGRPCIGSHGRSRLVAGLHRHRHRAGPALSLPDGRRPPCCQSAPSLFEAPARYDLGLLERQLHWARGGDARRP